MTTPTPRPWFKSRILWFGLLGVALICGAWVDSRYHRLEMSTGTSPGGYLVHVRGALGIGIWDSSHSSPVRKPYVNLQNRNPELVVWFRKTELVRSMDNTGWNAFFPHWLILSIWIAICGVLMLLRHVRIRKYFAMLPIKTLHIQN